MYGGSDQSSARKIAVDIIIGLLLAALLLPLFNPTLGPFGTAFAVVVLVGLAVAVILVLLGLPAKAKSRWRDFRSARLANEDLRLIPEAARLTALMHRLLFGDGAGDFKNLLRQIDIGKSSYEDFVRLGVAFEVLSHMFEVNAPWPPMTLLCLVRGVAGHFALVNPYLDRCYDAAPKSETPADTEKAWETFKEQYNHLRESWRLYADHAMNVQRWTVTVGRLPARSLHEGGVGTPKMG